MNGVNINADLDWKLIGASVVILIVSFLSYSNHFDNGFYFDDTHTIVDNGYVHDISNFKRYFTDISTYGTNPGNRTYNPILTTLNAIDYWIAGGLDSSVFHTSIYISYILLWVLLYFFFRNIFELCRPNEWNGWIALFCSAFFFFHTANAETINYIIMRSDSFSTLMVVMGLVMWQYSSTRKWGLYLIPAILAIGTKETGFMFCFLLLLYVLLIEEDIDYSKIFKPVNLTLIKRSFLKAVPALVVCSLVFFGARSIFFPGNVNPVNITSGPGSGGSGPGFFESEPWYYFITQWHVISHYLGNFVLPIDLAVDKDFQIIRNPYDKRVVMSLLLILALVGIAIKSLFTRESRPIAFGILWFFVTLAPTSSIIPFGQIANDHRPFFGTIGLVLSMGWWIALKCLDNKEAILKNKVLKYAILSTLAAFLLSHAWGTYQRNEVWGSSESLWYDATQKAPNNGRTQMNYGLTQMAKGKYDVAYGHFSKAMELTPYWSYIHINMGILRNAMGFPVDAEQYFKNAIQYNQTDPNGYFYFARFLVDKGRLAEAESILRTGLSHSPGYTKFNVLLNQISATHDSPESNTQDENRAIQANNYIQESLEHYKAGNYQACILAAQKAIDLNQHVAVAYNNICSAYNAMSQWKEAIEACEKALALAPDFELASNNLKVAIQASNALK